MRPDMLLQIKDRPESGGVKVQGIGLNAIRLIGSSVPVYTEKGTQGLLPGETRNIIHIKPPKGTKNGLVAVLVSWRSDLYFHLQVVSGFLLRVDYLENKEEPFVYLGQEWVHSRHPIYMPDLRFVRNAGLWAQLPDSRYPGSLSTPAHEYSTMPDWGGKVVPGNLLCKFLAGVVTEDEFQAGVYEPVGPYKKRIDELEKKLRRATGKLRGIPLS